METRFAKATGKYGAMPQPRRHVAQPARLLHEGKMKELWMNEYPKLSDAEIIDVRNGLLAKVEAAGGVTALSIHDQNLYDACNIALGVALGVVSMPESREEARERVSRLRGHVAECSCFYGLQ
jgi:hypothetical protein